MNAETFCEQFETFAEVPNGVAKLREMILQLAVQGKLVPHDENDGPAIVTHSEGNQITDSTDRVIPKGWAIASLGDVARLRRGFDLPVGNRKTGNIPIFAANGIVGHHDEVGVTGPGVVTGRSGTIGKVHFVPCDYWPLNTALYVENFHGNDPQFIVLLLRSIDLKRFSSQTAVPTLNRNVAHKAIVHVPPLAEQRRVVAKVDQLLGLCDELAARQAARRESRSALVAATLDRLVSPSSPAEFPTHTNRLRNHFDQLFDTPTTIPQLRQSILQLAVQGQLVPQDASDERASTLAARLEAGRDDLIAQRGLIRSQRLPPILRDEVPHAVPDHWEWVKIGNICPSIVPNRDKPKSFSGTIPWITLPDIDEDNFRVAVVDRTRALSQAEIGRFNARIVPKGSVIMSCIGRFGVSAVLDEDVVPNQQIHAFVVPDGVVSKYLAFCIRAQIRYFERSSTSTTIAYLNKTKCDSMPLPLPPLSEQKRIVAKVTELLSLCDALEAKLTQAESASTELLAAAVHHLLQNSAEPQLA